MCYDNVKHCRPHFRSDSIIPPDDKISSRILGPEEAARLRRHQLRDRGEPPFAGKEDVTRQKFGEKHFSVRASRLLTLPRGSKLRRMGSIGNDR